MNTRGNREVHSEVVGRHAVVLGGSLAGLLAARVLIDHFERVTLIERDAYPETAEVLACREGFALAVDLMISRVRIASDCVGAVRSLEGSGMRRYGHVVRELKAAMASFEGAEVVHEGRASNIGAHTLARSSIYESVGRHVWFFDPPDGVCTSYVV